MQPEQYIQDINDRLARISTRIDQLEGQFYKNNFSASQDFNKKCSFNVSIKIPSYSSLPNCEVGELAESGGTLYICSATNVWTVVGTQT